MLGLYVHIPFCQKICTYCDFCKRIAKDDQMIWDYLYTLKNEYSKHKDKKFDTIYIGGGTPSLLNLDQLNYLFSIFSTQNSKEYTIEVNPESYTKEKGLLFKQFNVNRVSLGVQTFNEEILKDLNRGHNNTDVYNTINHLNEIGLTNISVDLIFSLPNQTLKDVEKDLKIIKDLKITHISYYSLILEKNTVLYHRYQNGLFTPTNIDIEANMFKQIIKKLKDYGFIHYEVSNFAKEEKYKSDHNILYWSLQPYEAIGAGSFGFSGNYRYYHTNNITNYIKGSFICIEEQTDYNMYQDYLIFGLRMLKGINVLEVESKFNRNIFKDFPKLEKFIEIDLLDYQDNYLKVTEKGLFLLNQIVEEFI